MEWSQKKNSNPVELWKRHLHSLKCCHLWSFIIFKPLRAESSVYYPGIKSIDGLLRSHLNPITRSRILWKNQLLPAFNFLTVIHVFTLKGILILIIILQGVGFIEVGISHSVIFLLVIANPNRKLCYILNNKLLGNKFQLFQC